MIRCESWRSWSHLIVFVTAIVAVGGCEQQPAQPTTAGPPVDGPRPGALVEAFPSTAGGDAESPRVGDTARVSYEQPVPTAWGQADPIAPFAGGELTDMAASADWVDGYLSDATESAMGLEEPGQLVLSDAVLLAQSPKRGAAIESTQTARSLSDDRDLFVGWPKPRVALVFTGQQWGFLEPCGCSGLENQKGGLIRRSSLLRQLKAGGWSVLPIDAGNQVRRFGKQSEIKFSVTVDGLTQMGYRAIGFGPDDLRLPAPELVVVVAPKDGQPSPFVCANVTVLDPSFTSPYLVLEQGGKKIGLTAVLGDRSLQTINNSDLTVCAAAEGIKQVWPGLQRARCDLYVLIAQATSEESVALARQFPQFSLVVSAGGIDEPTLQPDPIPGTKSQMIQVGVKGMYACVVGLYDDAAQPLRYQRVPLDERFPDTEEMLKLLEAYQLQLQEEGFQGLGLRPQPQPTGGKYVGSEACKDCHGKAWRVWKNGLDKDSPPKHAHAYATLERPPKRSKIPRNFDPECISCHVVGWNPQKHYPYESGFLSPDSTPHLKGVGCESCHGPGKAHVDAENGNVALSDDQIDALRQGMVLTLDDAEQTCFECHDLDNSPAFSEPGAFERYWAKIKH